MNKAKKIFTKYNYILSYIFLFVASYLIIRPVVPTIDDFVFGAVHWTPVYALRNYLSWSSRYVIEFFCVWCCEHYTAWKILNSVLVCFAAYSINKFAFHKQELKGVLLCCMITLCYPMTAMVSSGPCTTSVNYLWPLVFLLLSFLPIYNYLHGRKTTWPGFIVAFASVLFACNSEQCLSVLLFIYAIFFIVRLKSYGPSSFVMIVLTVCIISLIIIAVCPGHSNRLLHDTAQYFPEFNKVSFVTKFLLWFMSTFSALAKTPGLLTIFSLALLIYALLNNTAKCKKICCLFLVVFSLILQILVIVFLAARSTSSLIYANVYAFQKELGTLDWDIFIFWKTIFFEVVYFLLFAFCVLATLTKKSRIVVVITILAGIGSRLAMLFSPTMIASDDRTAIILVFAFYAASCWIYHKSYKHPASCKKLKNLPALLSYAFYGFITIFAVYSIYTTMTVFLQGTY